MLPLASHKQFDPAESAPMPIAALRFHRRRLFILIIMIIMTCQKQ